MVQLNCVICNKTFFFKNSLKKCCSKDCLKKYRQNLTLKQRGLNYDNVIGKIEKYIVDNYHNYGMAKTLKECLKDNHISSKTYSKYCKQYNTSYNLILSNYNIPKQHSKFQTSVTKYVRNYFYNCNVIEEATFDDCTNPKTNCKLKFDIYIPNKNIAIECDGVQHNKKDYYFNNLAIKSGFTPSYVTDKIKESYCEENNIKLIRIPYSRIINKEYVYSFLCT